MPRVARVVYAGIPHHVTQRGNRGNRVFFDDRDRRGYLALLREYASQQQVEVVAYCLMTNHVHLVAVPGRRDSFERTFRPLHTRHAQRLNRSHGWRGHVWQGRYFAAALDGDYLWAAIRYVELNPVRAGLARQAEDYPWSSAASHCGLRTDAVLASSADWERQLQVIGDWSRWLATGNDDPAVATIRHRTAKGLPCGSGQFVADLERAAG